MNTTPSTEAPAAFWPTRYGLVKAVPTDNPVARSLQRYGEWSEKEIDLLGTCLQEGQHVLEFGAEYGAHTLWLSQAVGPLGKVHVFEPARRAFQLLCANVAINELGNVYAQAQWLGTRAGEVASADVPALLPLAAMEAERFRCTSVDESACGPLHLIKNNVQGALLDLLAGAGETIRRDRPLLYTRLSGLQRAEEEVRAIKELGYRCWSHVPYLYNADNFRKDGANIFPGCVWQNVIAAPVEGRFELDAGLEL